MKFKDFFGSGFGDNLINCLPGIFYLYEKIDNQYLLKRWNKNHVKEIGFSDKELLNMHVLQFFRRQEYKNINRAVNHIFKTGNVLVEAIITTKDGKDIPYSFEGYVIEDEGRKYFMGVGVDISKQYRFEKDLIEIKSEKEQLSQVLDLKNRELVSTALQISQNNELFKYTCSYLDELSEKTSCSEISQELNTIKKLLKLKIRKQDNWEIFKLRFREVHKDFFDKLYVKHPGLTKSELRFCSYLRIQLSSSQISFALNVSNEAIRKTRYRIRKKMNLLPENSLEDYISNF